jgi:16S rRNA G966 N2-methylase RsmD
VAAAVIEHNRDAVAASAPGPTVVVHQLTVQRWVERLDGPPDEPYDVAFCDPPYTTSSLDVRKVLASLTTSGLLAATALVVLERSARDAEWTFDDPLRAVWDRRYGEAHLWVAGVSA